jgi:hypothetical protein
MSLFISFLTLWQLEEENTALYARCKDNDEKQRAADAKTVELLDILDDVRDLSLGLFGHSNKC